MNEKFRKGLLALGIFCLVVAVVAFIVPEDSSKSGGSETESVSSMDLSPASMSSMDRECLFAYISEEDVDLNVLELVDVEPEEEITEATQVTFAADVSAGQDVYLLHYNGEEWEAIYPDSVDEGYITATFTSLSPVAVVSGTSASGDATQNSSDDTSSEDGSQAGAGESASDETSSDVQSDDTAATDDTASGTDVEAGYGDGDDSFDISDDSESDEDNDGDTNDSSSENSADSNADDSSSSSSDSSFSDGSSDSDSNTDSADETTEAEDTIALTYMKAHGMNLSEDESQTPDIYVYADDELLTEGEDYTLSFYDYNLSEVSSEIATAGTYYVKAVGTGEYSGAVTGSFDVTRLKSADFVISSTADSDSTVEASETETVTSTSLTVMLSGQIDDIYGNAVSGVVVSADSGAATSTTGSTGTFSIEGLATGTHSVSFIRDSVTIATVNVVAESTSNVNVTETYLDAGFSLSYAASLVTTGSDEVILVSFTGAVDESAVSTVTEAEVSSGTTSSSDDSDDDEDDDEDDGEDDDDSSGKKTASTTSSSSGSGSGTTKKTSSAAPSTGDKASVVFPLLIAIVGVNLVGVGVFKRKREDIQE